MPPFEEEDTRKVQTAVFGNSESDVPVFLPMEADDFGTFIRRYPERAFYCGTLLGGCGKKLSPKHYRDRKCHFAHVSAAANCLRTERDEASADHLYIGQAVATWLRHQGQRAVQTVYKPTKHQVRAVVDVSYSPARRLIRVQLAQRSKREWEEADAELRARHAGLDWFMGPDSLVANWQVDRQGYALRIRCRSVGASREVEVGTQFPDQPVEWTGLSQCTLTPEGRVVTPSLVQTPAGVIPRHTRQAKEAPPPAALSIAPNSLTITEATPANSTRMRRCYEVSLRISAQLSLPAQADSLDGGHTYQPIGAALTIGDDGRWLITADSVHRIDAEDQNGPHPKLPAQPEPTPEEVPPGDAEIVSAFLGTLQDTARSHGVVTMATLRKRALIPGHTLTTERWRNLLIQVEQPRTPGKPILSALIKGPDGGPAPFFRDVLRGLGWTKDFSDTELLTIWNRERRRVHASHSTNASTPVPAEPESVPRLPAPSPPIRTRRADSAALDGRAAYDALLDQAREAQRANDVASVEHITLHLEQIAVSPDRHETVRELTDWVVDRTADALYEDWERLAALTGRLNREGDDLHADQLRRLLRRAEELAEQMGTELGADERSDIARWRQHLAGLAERPTLSEIRAHASAVRLALRRAVREGRPTTWGELSQRIATPLAVLHPDDKVAVLVEVDRETPDDKPPLSALIASHGSDRPHPLYRQVLFNLDRVTPPPEALYMHWRMALLRHFEMR
ncbi:hypothetical protein SAMN05446589_1094 [Streptomyces sp. OV198]|uniref:hypothetical protein n=1 Tax=Streptomyces sp. OV198 TaxID=1882787 RepID=UPI000BC8145C|nr:hypothetical protein [Streptomyces sp. OV198]SOE56790.1 hypothetical protein SAMN05446589_1094 [Streptomyces sp. OV198]